MSTGIPPSPSVENQRTDVIDLTQDDSNSPPRLAPQTPSTRPNEASRPPRFGRNIMADVVDLEQEPTAVPSNDQQSSPEVQWLGSYSRAGPSTTSTTSNAEAGAAYHNHQRTLRGSNLLNLLSAENYRLPPVPMNRADVFREEMALRTRHLVGAFRQAMSPFWVGLPPRDTSDFDLHDLSLTYLRASEPGHPRRGPAPQVPPAYEAPAAPPEGFTTCANEDEVVVCPNCDRELGTGESPEQKQVWVARHCGHVRRLSSWPIQYMYCGRLLTATLSSGLLWSLYQESRSSWKESSQC